jgi:D-lactate dehydrogenase (cytochrome)
MIYKTDPDFLENYRKDASNFTGWLEQLYIPESIDELKDALRLCYTNNIPITISGGGTGLVGGRVPLGGAVISTEKLNKILSIDSVNLTAHVQGGLPYSELDAELSHYELFYPPNPTEINGTIGGNVSTNASGSRTFKYGQTRRYIEYLKIILPNSEELRINRGEFLAKNGNIEIKSVSGRIYSFEIPPIRLPKVKHAAGYYFDPNMDAIDLFIGSEGTLGVVIEARMKLLPKSDNVLGLIIFFDDHDKLLDFVEFIRQESTSKFSLHYSELKTISARLIEYFDSNSLNLLRKKYVQIPENAAGAIWIEQEYSYENENELMETWMDCINKYTALSDITWVAMNQKEHENFRDFRHELPLQIVDILAENKQVKFNPDGAVPDKYLKEFYYFIKNEVTEKHLSHVIFGHIGNSHFHANVFVKNEQDLANAELFYDNCIDEALRLGGTISAEHGIGKLKNKYLIQMFGKEGVQQMINIKKLFDAKMLLGQRTLFDI